jgi:MoxR-like ATPase
MTAAKTDLHDIYDGIFGENGFLRSCNVEREELIGLVGLSTISGVDMLLLGDPGTGKTFLLELLTQHCITDAKLFTHLLAKEMSADEVLGPRDVMAMKEGKIRRLTDGYLPEAHYGVLDECFKASPPMLNPLLDLVANRVLKTGGVVQNCDQLIAILMASNELPDREDLAAFRDRIGITYFVKPVETPDGQRAVVDIQLREQTEGRQLNGLKPLSLSSIQKIRGEISQILVPDEIRDMMVKAQQKWLEHGHPPSQRRIGQMWRIVRAHAWANRRTTVSADDLMPCQHMAFNHPENANTAREVVLEFASEWTRKAQRSREAFEPLMREMEEIRISINSADGDDTLDEEMDHGFKLLRQLRQLSKSTGQQIKQGEEMCQDVSELVAVKDAITGAYDWAKNLLAGADEAEDSPKAKESSVGVGGILLDSTGDEGKEP